MAEARTERPLRVVFMGTPGFAAVSLQALLEWDGCEVVGVFTQPDRPCGRGRECKPSEVKVLAMEHDIPVFQPEKLKSEDEIELVRALNADVGVVAAYGLILPRAVLDAPRLGCINVHGSLLPRYRGAAPIQRAIMNGDSVTGISIMQMEEGLDSGPVLMQRALGIGIDDTAEVLHDELAVLGARLLVETLAKLETGQLLALTQDDELATYAHKLRKEEGHIDFTKSARTVHNQVRGLYPWPGAWFDWDDAPGGKPLRLVLEPGRVGPEHGGDIAPGTLVCTADGDLGIACADAMYEVPRVKPSGKKFMDAKAFFCGYVSRLS